MPSVSWSEVNLYRKCPKAHDYRYSQRLTRKRPIAPMLKGKIVGEMINAFVLARSIPSYTNDPWSVLEKYELKYRDLLREEREVFGGLIGDCEKIFEGYLRKYKNDPLKYEDVEAFVATDLAPEIRFIGYIDKVAVDDQGRRWLTDHKVMKSIPSADDRFHELQLTMYIWAWNRWNPSREADGICWDYLRAKAPAEPDLLKNGQLSQRKNIDTDAFTYRAAIKRHKLDPKPYKKMLASLENKDATFFERVFLPQPPKVMIESVIKDFRTTAIMIQNLQGVAPRSMSKFNCSGCEFKAICEAEVRGLDHEFVRKAQYVTRDRFTGDVEHDGKKKGTKKKVAKKGRVKGKIKKVSR